MKHHSVKHQIVLFGEGHIRQCGWGQQGSAFGYNQVPVLDTPIESSCQDPNLVDYCEVQIQLFAIDRGFCQFLQETEITSVVKDGLVVSQTISRAQDAAP